jgi:hypothetical protein
MSEDQLEGLINEFKRDDNLIKLLRTLSPQLELLVKRGSPDLRGFYEDLEKAELGLDCDKLRELTLLFALEGVSNKCTISRLFTDLIKPGRIIR